MTWSRRHTLIAGVALIVLTNAIALGGVAWNRSGEPDSVLKLTQREAPHPYRYGIERESGGLVLQLDWRVLADDPNLAMYPGAYNSVPWLDEAKLAVLGFDVSRSAKQDRRGRHYERLLPREALIVLEFDGPTWPKALELVRKHAARQAADAAALPSKPEFAERAKAAAAALKREETSNSRLFAVDAGLDAAALRAKYPDRSRYAIVTGKVRAHRDGRGDKLQGYIAEIHNNRVNVPLELMPAIGTRSRPRVAAVPDEPGYQASIAFGKRFEPWLVDVSK
jgi:hypothetical protein